MLVHVPKTGGGKRPRFYESAVADLRDAELPLSVQAVASIVLPAEAVWGVGRPGDHVCAVYPAMSLAVRCPLVFSNDQMSFSSFFLLEWRRVFNSVRDRSPFLANVLAEVLEPGGRGECSQNNNSRDRKPAANCKQGEGG